MLADSSSCVWAIAAAPARDLQRTDALAPLVWPAGSYDTCGRAVIFCINCTNNPDCDVVPDTLKDLLAMGCTPQDIAARTPIQVSPRGMVAGVVCVCVCVCARARAHLSYDAHAPSFRAQVYIGVTSATCNLALSIAADPVGARYITNVSCCGAGGCNAPPPPPSAPACPAPNPALEQCCTRRLSNPASTLRVQFGSPRRLSSVTFWNDVPGGPPVYQSDAQLAGLDVSLRDGAGSITGCAVLPPPPPPGVPAMPGYTGWPVVCGVDGSVASVSLPAILSGAMQPLDAVTVRLCTYAASAPGQPGPDATLWLQGDTWTR